MITKIANWPIIKPILSFLKKYGVDAVLALIVFNSPTWLMLFIKTDSFLQFGTAWTAFWIGGSILTPGWLLTLLLAVFMRWLRGVIYQGYLWFRETMDKLQTQNQLMAYLSAEEIKMILDVAKEVNTIAQAELEVFRGELRKRRIQMLDEQWTKESKDETI